MTTATKERINMPEISAAAYKIHLNNPEYIKQNIKHQHKKIILITCQTCNKHYDQAETTKMLSTIPAIAGFTYNNQCLNCIKQVSRDMKTSYQPDLREAKEDLKELTRAYQKAHKHFKSLEAKYQKYDYQASMINHYIQHNKQLEQAKQAKLDKKANNKKSSKQIKQATAMKILSNLTNEQQIAILAIINKQA